MKLMKKKHFEFELVINCSKPSDCHEAILAKLKPILAYENFSSRILSHEKNHVIEIDVYEEDHICNGCICKKPAKMPTEKQIANLLK